MRIGLFNKSTNIDFVKYHKSFFVFSIVFCIIMVCSVYFRGFNLGIDFKGGIMLEVKYYNKNPELDIKNDILQKFKSIGISHVDIIKLGNSLVYDVTVNMDAVNKYGDSNVLTENIKNTLKEDYSILRNEFVGPSVSGNIIIGAVYSVLFSLLGIFLYLWFRFDWQYGIMGVITLIHDCIMGLGFLSIFRFELDISVIAAVLTIIGYSINDTVVNFDQVRENLKRYSDQDKRFILNRSINDVFSRSLSTSITVFLVLISIFFFGGNSLKGFSFTMIIGVVFGTYSSICLAVPMLMYLGNIKKIKDDKEDDLELEEDFDVKDNI
jgi:preprotein translocase subunit SecF